MESTNSPSINRAQSIPLLPHSYNLSLKAECLQPCGSYKIRGARRYLEQLTAEGKLETLRQGVSTASAGNLGQALAAAAASLNIPCTVFVPSTTPLNKKEKILSLGAQLVELSFPELFALVRDPPSAPGFVHPLLTPGLLEGYGEIAAEIILDAPRTDIIVVPFGLGGLALGIARRLKKIRPAAKVIAAELELCAPFKAALANGSPVRVEKINSFVDAIGTEEVLPYVFREASHLLAGSLTVSLAETREALRILHEKHGLRVEGAAAVAFAAALRFSRSCGNKRVCTVLSGGNIDPEVHAREIRAARLRDKKAQCLNPFQDG